MVTFKGIIEELIKTELQNKSDNTMVSCFIKWTETDNIFKSFEGRYRLYSDIGYDRTFNGFINEVGTITIAKM